MQALIQQLQALVFQLRIQLALIEKPQGMNNREKLYFKAKEFIGVDASPADTVPDEVACAESVNAIHKACFGFPIGGDVSTYRLYAALKNSPFFTIVITPLRGDVVLSPTGYGNGTIPGHVGYLGDNDIIYSNDSGTGLFSTKYSLTDWRQRYQQKGGFPVLFFRRV